MEVYLVFMGLFALGMTFQALFMIGEVWRKENLKKIVNVLVKTLIVTFVLLIKCNNNCNEKFDFVIICLAGAIFLRFHLGSN